MVSGQLIGLMSGGGNPPPLHTHTQEKLAM